jgi:thiaminase/transcriptional activator TenA
VSLAATLWRATGEMAAAALAHPFVQGLGDGTLPLAGFQGYVAQDAYFLEVFARAYALALARSPDREGMWAFFDLLGGAQEELKLHAGYAARWQVDMTSATPAEATRHYTDFLLATAATGAVGEICAAMTPCMRLYAHVGQALAATGADRAANPYAEWVRTYADPTFEALARRLEGLLDRYAVDSVAIRELYRRAMALELAFFEAAWRVEG